MSLPSLPKLEPRRFSDFENELLKRARTWIPAWSIAEGERDFGRALLEIAARFSAEVAERLDGVGDKMARGFLDWLAVQGEAARPARMPVVFKLAETASEPVLAPHPVKMQVDVQDATVTFETETDLSVVPGQLDLIVGVDPTKDAFYLPPPGLSSLEPREPLPAQWRLKNFAAPGTAILQFDPGLGLVEDMLVEINGEQYRISNPKDDLATINPEVPAGDGFANGTLVTEVEAFRPFDGARNQQEHVLYLGDTDLLNIEAEATIEASGIAGLGDGIAWEYFGTDVTVEATDPEPRWRPLKFASAAGDKLVLSKPKGTVEPTKVGPAESRWFRARKAHLDGDKPALTTDEIKLRVNPLQAGESSPPALSDPSKFAELPAVEAIVNTTPSPTSDFYPLGREPRLFDTLYLGSKEAFSKAGAKAWVKFDLADPTLSTFSVVRDGQFANYVIAGVANDGALHLFQYLPATGLTRFRDREPLQPPLPNLDSKAESTPKISLDRRPPWRLPTWSYSNELLVATLAGGDVWIWHENEADQSKSGWQKFGQLPPSTAQRPSPADGLVYLGGGTPKLAALRDGVLSFRNWPAGPRWDPVETKTAQTAVALKSIVPILADNGSGVFETSITAGMIGVSDASKLFRVSVDGTCTELLPGMNFASEIRPAAVMEAPNQIVWMAVDTSDPPHLVAFRTGAAQPLSSPLDPDEKVAGALEVLLHGGQFHFLASVMSPGGDYLASWAPFDPTAPADPFKFPLPGNVGRIGGAPAALPGHVIIPGSHADIVVAEFDLSRRIARTATLNPGIVLPAAARTLVPNDIVTLMDGNLRVPRTVNDFGITKDGETFYPIDSAFPANAAGPMMAYRTSGARLTGAIDVTSLAEFTLEMDDRETAPDHWLLIDSDFRKVTGFVDQTSNPRIVTIDPPFAGAGNGYYLRPLPTGGRTAPFMRLNPATNGNWDAALLQRAPLLFPGATPKRQLAKAFSTDIGNHPTLIVLAGEFTSPPPATPAAFIVDAAAGEWSHFLGDTSTNPELAWEYWNGTGWWKLDLALDETLHLKNSGELQFTVPQDIAETDWAGKTNHWIRARLIGGDYGRETVVVVTEPVPDTNKTEQTVKRTTEGIQPPYALNVMVAYAVDKHVVPTFLLTKDSGTLRNQSDANRTPGAMVEVFTPLIYALTHFETAAAEPSKSNGGAASEDCMPDCECPEGTASTSPAKKKVASAAGTTIKKESSDCECAPATAAEADTASLAARRALYLGFTSKLSGEAVNVLFVVEKERGHDKLAPLQVDALTGDRFVRIVAPDETRALGETGLLKMSLSVEPVQAELFGKNRSWLRLTPGEGDVEWNPALSGVYLNAVWARAAETMTRELVGSSEGAPRLILNLARPPLLQNSLELRVKEELGEEERKVLIEANPDKVKSDVVDLPGDWVLWEQVLDPDDSEASNRVYALDEESGTIRFGDGRHGAIPPVGVDTIVAFKYERTERAANGAVPANFVTARTPLNLVTPVDSVEAVVAADQSAGGVAPESGERVLHFGAAKLRHRGRAVTARDFEDLALERFAGVAQARCFARRGRIRLVVVMRGRDPQPSRAQIRELKRMLLAASPAALAAPGALNIEGPAVRRLRIELKLRVETLDVAGRVAKDAKDRLLAYFDSELGGEHRDGWLLGASPREEDVAEALLDIQDLESISSITLIEIDEKDRERPWPENIGPRELAMLAGDGVRVAFEIVEAVE